MPWMTHFQSVADRLRGQWFAAPSLKSQAATTIETLIDAVDSLEDQKAKTLAEKKREVRKAQSEAARLVQESKRVAARIDEALAEMRKTKGNLKSEKPVAILLSPFQGQNLRDAGRSRETANVEGATVREYRGLPVYVCRGVYGPLVVTEDALAAMTRQAPELQMRSL